MTASGEPLDRSTPVQTEADASSSGTAGQEDLLLWIDLETTGSDEAHDCIIEVGAILTTTELDVLGECSIVVAPTAEGLGRLMQNAFVRDMHQGNGLLPLLLDHGTPARKPHEAAKALLGWAEGLGAKQGRTVLAGSGVGHFDRRFIARWMPQVDKFLRYWCIDIGVVRRAHDMWVGTPVSAANDAKTHRALDDIRCHVEEAQAFRTLWRNAGPEEARSAVYAGASSVSGEQVGQASRSGSGGVTPGDESS